MADYSGKAQFFVAFKCPVEHEEEGDELFAYHADWMKRTHPQEGETALLQYTVSKRRDDQGSVMYLLAEIYETAAGVENHSKLAWGDEADSRVNDLMAFRDKCHTIGWGSSEVLHSLW